MRITAFSDVCLRVLMVLAAVPEPDLTTARVIAEGIDTPYTHVSKADYPAARTRSRHRRARPFRRCEHQRGGPNRDGRLAAAPPRYQNGCRRLRIPQRSVPAPGGLRGALRRAREAFSGELDGLMVSALPHGRVSGPVLAGLGTD